MFIYINTPIRIICTYWTGHCQLANRDWQTSQIANLKIYFKIVDILIVVVIVLPCILIYAGLFYLLYTGIYPHICGILPNYPQLVDHFN